MFRARCLVFAKTYSRFDDIDKRSICEENITIIFGNGNVISVTLKKIPISR